MWPDPGVAGGWAACSWQPDPATGRGWRIPLQLAAGDVLEFGADTAAPAVRWYGIMDSYEVDQWPTVQGPYPHPGAPRTTRPSGCWRCERYLPPLEAEPPTRRTVPTDATRTVRDDGTDARSSEPDRHST